MTPPSTGPRIGPTAIGRLTVGVTRPSEVPPPGTERAARMARVISRGKITPAPPPGPARKAIRLLAFQASEHSAEPPTNKMRAPIHSRLPPNRAWAQPTTGIATPRASRYPVLTHWIWLTVECSAPTRVCSAMETIVVSSTAAGAPAAGARVPRAPPLRRGESRFRSLGPPGNFAYHKKLSGFLLG